MNNILWTLVLILFFVACKQEIQPTVPTSPSVATVYYAVVAQARASRKVIETTGSIIASEEADIRSEMAGKIKSIHFKEGSFVRKGDLLVRLEDDDLQAQWNKLKVDIEWAESQQKRNEKLFAASAITEEEYAQSVMNVKTLRASEDVIRASLRKTKITAPFSGIIGLRQVSEGAFLSTGDKVASIQNLQPLKLEFSVPEKYNPLITTGKTVDFNVSYHSDVLTATIYAKEPKMDPNTRSVLIRATFANPQNKIFPGSFAEISIPVGKSEDVILIPSEAYIPKQNGASVFVKRKGLVSAVDVRAGERTEKNIEILEGLMDGDTVITTGILQLKPGMPVEVQLTDMNMGR